jgi:hypothetical protein
MNALTPIFLISLFLFYTPAQAKCQTYGYQTICDNASEYKNAPAPAAANQDPFARPSTGRVFSNNNSNNRDTSFAESIGWHKECLSLPYAQALACQGQINRQKEEEYRANGGVIIKCRQIGNNTNCYAR